MANTWQKVKLGDVVEVIKEQYVPDGKNLNYIGLEHIDQQTLSINGIGKSTELQSGKFFFKPNDILFGKLRPYFRKVVKPQFDGVCSTDIMVIRAKENFSQDFLYYFIADYRFINIASQSNSGTRMPRADWSYLKDLEFQFPNLATQKSIAFILSSLDDKIELLREQNKILENIAQVLFKSWFVDFEFTDNTAGRNKSSNKYLIRELNGTLPADWRIGVLGEIAKLKSGYAFKESDFATHSTKKVIKIKDLKGLGRLDLGNLNHVSESVTESDRVRMFKLNMGDVLVAMSGNTTGKIGVFYLENSEVYLNQRVGKFFPIQSEYRNFLYLFLMANNYESKILGMGYGSAQPNINPSQIENISMLLPDESTLRAFNDLVSPIFNKIFLALNEIDNLTTLRDTLLPKLIGGQLKLNEIQGNL